MKRNSIIIIAVMMIWCLSGCGQKVTEEQDIQVQDSESSIDTGSFSEEEYSFVLKRRGVNVTVHLKDCQCEYDKEDVKVYSKYFIDSDNAQDLTGEYLLHIRAPHSWKQFYVKDFKLDEETGTLYFLRETEGLSLQKMALHTEDGILRQENLLDDSSAEQMLLESLKLAEDLELIEKVEYPRLSELHFEFADGEAWKRAENTDDTHKISSLKGYIEGFEERLGKRFYVDYEWDEQKQKETVSPCALQKYDAQADKQAFEKCGEVFEQIMQGDWSEVRLIESLSSMWGMGGEEWIQADVNRDGMPELICQDGSGARTEHKKPINLIFAWNGTNADLVYMDLTDEAEFLFLTDEGNLIYEQSTVNGSKSAIFSKSYFDEKWNRIQEESLRVHYFYNEKEAEEYREYYGFKSMGKGLYFIKDYQDYSGEFIPRKLGYYDFEKEYHDLTGRDFLDDNEPDWEEVFKQALTGETFFDYEIKEDLQGEKYAVIKGVRKEYKDEFEENLLHLYRDSWSVVFPEKLEGAEVKEFAPYAFQNISMNDVFHGRITISPNIVTIGEHCFENCGLKQVFMDKEGAHEGEAEILTVGDSAFAGNPDLWGIYISDRVSSWGSAVFEECAPKRYFCYIPGTEEKNAALKAYALENGLYAAEIPAYYSETPMIDYPETPLTLMPDVRNFFYGENAWPDEIFCSFEYDDDAPDYGFPEWHIPCGEFCAVWEFGGGITASSELPSSDGRYAPRHLASGYGREYAWAEGAEGNGIGESIQYTDRWTFFNPETVKEQFPNENISFLEGDIEPDIFDGYVRYTEICIVNGYAKNQTVWEENGRVKRLLMYVEDKPFAYLELEDTIYPQYFTLPFDAIKAADGVDIHFQFVIEDVYPGTKYEDTCLTGLVVEFMGRHGH
ncbi:MAG: leucine-rich repeat domain-containing protein [Lachnospiraceae bacterium]|nr:leucine-rich repeat domain-containing protein [Lachnospiraceae bacterium]